MKLIKCPSCKKGNLIKVKDVDFDYYENTFKVEGLRCDNCGEEFPFEDAMQKAVDEFKDGFFKKIIR